MNIDSRRQEILQAMNSITRMERGKLSLQKAPGGRASFHKLQHWHQGKNHTRYVPSGEVAALQQAIAGHQKFQSLAQEFVELTVSATREQIETDAKKNSRRSSPTVTRRQKPS